MMKKTVKITVLADLHHYSQTLGTKGRAFELRSGSDQKCLAETGGIIDAAFSAIRNSDTDAVLIAGDVSNNGERVSHGELKEKLLELSKAKKVCLITATHDWCCDENPRRFDGDRVYNDVPVMKSDELRDFYAPFGPEGADSEFITHLGTCSYTADISDSLRILCLNDDQNGKGKAGFKEDHFKWIEKQIAKAKADGKLLVAMEHHLLMPHIHPVLGGGSVCVGDREKVASRLADAGLRLIFTGHSHLQAIDSFTSEKGNTIFEVNVGSLCGYPSPIVTAEFDGNQVHISTSHTEKFIFEGKEYNTLDYVRKHTLGLIDNVISAAKTSKEDFTERLSALGVNGEKIAVLLPVISPFIKYAEGLSVGQCYNKLRLLGIGKVLSKDTVSDLRDKPAKELIYEIFLSALDGGKVRYSPEDSYYRTVMGFMDFAVRLKDCKITRTLRECVKNILDGSEYNINDCIIKLED